MLISRIIPIMSIYRLPHGQYGYSGHILNLPQDVASFVNTLPRSPTTLDIVIVRKQGVNQTHRDFRVRRAVVLRALQWLVVNNKYYNDVVIDSNTLEMLPVDGHLNNFSSVFVQEEQVSQQNDDLQPHPQSTFLPTSARTVTEQQTIQ